MIIVITNAAKSQIHHSLYHLVCVGVVSIFMSIPRAVTTDKIVFKRIYNMMMNAFMTLLGMDATAMPSRIQTL